MAVKPSEILIENYSYQLPPSRIAQEPLPLRDSSKLLVYDSGRIVDNKFENLSDFIPANSIVVANNSRVIHARLFFNNETGAQIELFLLEPIKPFGVELAMAAHSQVEWFAYIGNARRWKTEELTCVFSGITVRVEKKSFEKDMQRVIVSWSGNLTMGELLEKVGHVPLPPYMKRDDVIADKERYQTVYAKPQGSVAAPTAGLHFTPRVIASLIAKGVDIEHVTLHVGAGTFKSVGVANIVDHVMHHENFVVSKAFVEELFDAVIAKKKIVCVGTTSVRTIESLYWIGVKLFLGRCEVSLGQWEAYDLPQKLRISTALNCLLNYMAKHDLRELATSTQILIVPGYNFKFVNMLITNFHVPKSTLLLLVAAFIGEDWRKVYSHALSNDYRFLSYGDSSLLIPQRVF